MIDHPLLVSDGAAQPLITVDDCEKVTRQLQHVLEVDGCAYERLEVSSPGLDRPLKKAADFARFAGQQVEVTLKLPFKGRKKYRGELQMQTDPQGAQWRIVLGAEDGAAKPTRAQVRATRAARAEGEETGKAEQALDFSLDEVREARLVPVVDFKGRRLSEPLRALAPAAAGSSPDVEVDGGRIQ